MKFTKTELLKEVTAEHVVVGAIFKPKGSGQFVVVHDVTPKGNVVYAQCDTLEAAIVGEYFAFGSGGISMKRFLNFRNDYFTSTNGIDWSVQITPLPVGTQVTLIKDSQYEGDDKWNPKHGVVGTVIENTQQMGGSFENPFHYHVEWSNGESNCYHLIGDLEVVGIASEPEPEVEEPKPETPKARAIRLLEEEDTLEVSGRSTGGGSWVNRIVKARNKAGIDKRLVIKITEGHYQEKNLVLVSKAVQDLEVFTNSRLPITVVKA